MSIQFPNLGINLGYVGKSINIFGFEITFYGLVIALGMLLGLGFVLLEAKRCGEDRDSYLEMMIVSLITGVIGARLLYVCFSWNLYKGNIVQIFNIRNGGLTFYGGLFGGILGAMLYCAVKKKSFMQMADTASMGLLIGQIIGRWGDFFNRESFGEYTNNIFAMQLPLSAVRSGQVTTAMRETLETIGDTSYIQVHPVFLYESAWCLLLLLLMLVWKRKKYFHGEVFLRYLAGYGLGRFLFEFLRTDKLMIPGTPIGISQFISAVLFVIATLIVAVETSMAKKRAALRKRRREQEYEAQERAAREAEAEEYRDRLRLERAFGNKENTNASESFAEKNFTGEKDSTDRGSFTEEEFGDKGVFTEKDFTDRRSFTEEEDFADKESFNKEEEFGDEEAFKAREISDQEAYAESLQNGEETDAKNKKTTDSATDSAVSEEDEWLYSKPRRFAKKPVDEQKN